MNKSHRAAALLCAALLLAAASARDASPSQDADGFALGKPPPPPLPKNDSTKVSDDEFRASVGRDGVFFMQTTVPPHSDVLRLSVLLLKEVSDDLPYPSLLVRQDAYPLLPEDADLIVRTAKNDRYVTATIWNPTPGSYFLAFRGGARLHSLPHQVGPSPQAPFVVRAEAYVCNNGLHGRGCNASIVPLTNASAPVEMAIQSGWSFARLPIEDRLSAALFSVRLPAEAAQWQTTWYLTSFAAAGQDSVAVTPTVTALANGTLLQLNETFPPTGVLFLSAHSRCVSQACQTVQAELTAVKEECGDYCATFFSPVQGPGSAGSAWKTSTEVIVDGGSLFDLDTDWPPYLAGRNMKLRLLVRDSKQAKYLKHVRVYLRRGAIAVQAKHDVLLAGSNGTMALSPKGHPVVEWTLPGFAATRWFTRVITPAGMGRTNLAVELSLDWCQEETCPAGAGSCQIRVDAGLPVGFCSCNTDRSGPFCDEPALPTGTFALRSVLLIGSNAAMLPAVVFSYRNKLLLEGTVFVISAAVSAMYHTCEQGLTCFGLSYFSWQVSDFTAAFAGIFTMVAFLSGLDTEARAGLVLFVFALLQLLVTQSATGILAVIVAVVAGLSVLLLGICRDWRQARRQRGKSMASSGCTMFVGFALLWMRHSLRWRRAVPGMLLAVAAIAMFVLETNDNYWIAHSLWHVCGMLSIYLLISSRRTRGHVIHRSSSRLTSFESEGDAGMASSLISSPDASVTRTGTISSS